MYWCPEETSHITVSHILTVFGLNWGHCAAFLRSADMIGAAACVGISKTEYMSSLLLPFPKAFHM